MTNTKVQNVYNALVNFIIEGGDWQNSTQWGDAFEIVLTDVIVEAGGEDALNDHNFVEQMCEHLMGQILNKAQQYGAQLA